MNSSEVSISTAQLSRIAPRLRFLTEHWSDLNGWHFLPLYLAAGAEGVYRAAPWWVQVGFLAAAFLLCLLWKRTLTRSVESRIGTVVRLKRSPAGVKWRGLFLGMVVFFLASYGNGYLSGQRGKQDPLGFLESNLQTVLILAVFVTAAQVVDRLNPASRRIAYSAAMVLAALLEVTQGGWPHSYAFGYLLLGLTMATLAIFDLGLLQDMAGPSSEPEFAEGYSA